jgi:high-affinity iron transporter
MNAPMRLARRLLVLLALACAGVAAAQGGATTPAAAGEAAAGEDASRAQTILHLLDYIGVDYPGAVDNGKVTSEDEYREMQEFTAQVAARVRDLPANGRRADLETQAGALERLVHDRAAAERVADASAVLKRAVVDAYALRLAPRAVPHLTAAARLYAAECAGCHGAQGSGDGPAARGLEPPPANFHDRERMDQRSVYGLYNTISLGVEGTSMAAYRKLSEDDRWALAFHVAALGTPPARIEEGRRLYEAGAARADFPDLGNVATLSTREVAARYGGDAARVQDYLRTHPDALAAHAPSPLAFARGQLAEARAQYARGNAAGARDAAIRAYLEGFETVESSLANVDADLMHEIERHMLEARAAIERGVPASDLDARIAAIDEQLGIAEERLGGAGLSASAAFTTSFLILLREGLEAILVLAAVIAFVKKTGRRDAMPWLHAGWLAALALGALTWVVATYVISISGASREMTEGVTGLLAAALLLYVGYWLHGKSYAAAWSRFIREHVGRALAARTLWAIGLVAFLAVYREIFEVILFYQALWLQAGAARGPAVLTGALAAAGALLVIGVAIFRYSVRLPLGPFFGVLSALLVALAIVFAGNGVAALQEAGAIAITPLDVPALPLLGFHPTTQTAVAQLVALAVAVIAFVVARRHATLPGASAA